jgi:pentatricopeptide repeat protein
VASGTPIKPSFSVWWFHSIVKFMSSAEEFEAKVVESNVLNTNIQEVAIFNAIIGGFFLLQDLQKAKRYIDIIPRYGLQPDKVTNIINIKIAIQEGNLSQAEDYLSKIFIDHSITTDELSFVCNRLLESYVNLRDYKSVMRLLEEMKQKDVPSTNYTINLLMAMHTPQEKVLLLAKYLKGEVELDVQNVTTAFAALCSQGNVEDITVAFDAITERMPPDLVLFGALINALGKANDTTTMLSYYHKMSQYHLEPNVVIFTTIIETFARLGQTQQMMKYFGIMQQLGIQPNVVTFGNLIKAFKAKGDRENARKFQQMAFLSQRNKSNEM